MASTILLEVSVFPPWTGAGYVALRTVPGGMMGLIGLKVPGIVIKNPGCVAKTYPGFFDDLEKLR